jgi:D-2-hydroxyacid dehydrogenase (NADP+)
MLVPSRSIAPAFRACVHERLGHLDRLGDANIGVKLQSVTDVWNCGTTARPHAVDRVPEYPLSITRPVEVARSVAERRFGLTRAPRRGSVLGANRADPGKVGGTDIHPNRRQPVTGPKLPARDEVTVQFAHSAYRLAERFEARGTGVRHFQTWTLDDTLARVGEADVLVISGFWRNEMQERAKRLAYIQSIGAGYDQFPLDDLRALGIPLANASGVNRDAVAQHGMALILALARHLPQARDNQRAHVWRGMISSLAEREDELSGHTLVVLGLGAIGSQLARIAKTCGMLVIGLKRDTAKHDGVADEVLPPDRLLDVLLRADFVALCCPLTAATRSIIDAAALAAMRPSCYLVNIARGGCVDEPALLDALRRKGIAGAAIDHFWDEPLPPESPFWDLDNVFITPHTGGETRKYEDRVTGVVAENLERLWAGRDDLENRIV